jgi:UDP-glucose 4-epimerase
MKIAITGASGFIGSWLCRELSRDHEVIAIIREASDEFRLQGISNLKVTRGKVESWNDLIIACEPDVLILAEWQGVANTSRNEDLQMLNITRQVHLANVAIQSGSKLVIGIGSQAEIGPVNISISEDSPDGPTTKYGFAKADVRKALMKTTYGTETRFIWMRVFSTYGPLDEGQWLIPHLVDNLSQGKEVALTHCEQEWNYLHAFDLARAFRTVIENETISGVVNVANPATISLKKVVDTISSYFDRGDLLKIGALEYRKDQVMNLRVESETLNSFGWKPIVDFSEGINETINWLLGKSENSMQLLNSDEIQFNLPLRPKIH